MKLSYYNFYAIVYNKIYNIFQTLTFLESNLFHKSILSSLFYVNEWI